MRTSSPCTVAADVSPRTISPPEISADSRRQHDDYKNGGASQRPPGGDIQWHNTVFHLQSAQPDHYRNPRGYARCGNLPSHRKQIRSDYRSGRCHHWRCWRTRASRTNRAKRSNWCDWSTRFRRAAGSCWCARNTGTDRFDWRNWPAGTSRDSRSARCGRPNRATRLARGKGLEQSGCVGFHRELHSG